MNSNTLPVAVYCRYSTDRQDARSLEDQERRCREYATRNGFEVSAVFSDAAISGAHENRAGLHRLLQDARTRPAPFKAVLVDDLSRLSRDLGATWRIVFEDLAAVDVRVIDVNTGMASDGANARLTFGALALVNDTFLQLVRHETHRGLHGRALAGFHTGGRTFGYMTVPEENAPDPEHTRMRPIINADEARIVQRVFRMFADGIAQKKIAATLNDEHIPAPHDGGKGHKIGRGWSHTTVRSMLQNERYVGRWTWNTSKWIRVPGRKSRRRVKRPLEEHVVREYPELAIIDRELWDAVQARFRRQNKGGRPAGSGPNGYLVTGLLRCGTCGGSITVTGASMKAGKRYATFGCTAHYSRGASVCPNNLTISERKATGALVDALQDMLTDPVVIQRFLMAFEKRLAERLALTPDGVKELDDRIREVEMRVRNLVDALAKMGWNEHVQAQIQDDQERLAALKAQRIQAKPRPVSVPTPDTIADHMRAMLHLLETDKVRGREVLARHLTPVVMTPEVDGDQRRYKMTGAFNIGAVINAKTPASEEETEVIGKASSGGRI